MISYVKELKKTRLPNLIGTLETPLTQSDIMSRIPHRAPFLFLDRITQMDPKAKILCAETELKADNPIFEGHFPNQPIFPGVLQLEMMGQAGLCLSDTPRTGLFTHIFHAEFYRPIRPGDCVKIAVKLVEENDFFGRIGGQLLVDGQLCSIGVLQAYYE